MQKPGTMIKSLHLTNVGPAAKMELEFGARLNLLTGDNGLGKSFLLDIVWWVLTRKWPAEVNPGLTAGRMARPVPGKEATIGFSFAREDDKSHLFTGTSDNHSSRFNRKGQLWPREQEQPANPGLVLYAMADGSFALWDPYKNYWSAASTEVQEQPSAYMLATERAVGRSNVDTQKHIPAYVFSPKEVWDGLQDTRSNNGARLCNGLIHDWASWQQQGPNGPFAKLERVLKVLSPSPHEKLAPGGLTRVSLDDVRDIPTIRMPYQQDVPVLHAAAGIRRIIALAYFLVWAWEEHKLAAELCGEAATRQLTFLIDEVESHLHPKWQRRIVPALLGVVAQLTGAKETEVQLIAATHSPLIMASVEPLFDAHKDAWFDFDLARKKVTLTHRNFEKRGEAARWLISEGFDLKKWTRARV